MTFENIRLEKADGIARLTIDRPKVMNALNTQTLHEMGHALDDVKADDSVRVLVITGEGDKAFVAGADINELATMKPMEAKGISILGQSVFGRLDDLHKPSIAMINGFALGGGCELALACTLRTASKKARIGLPEIGLGITPGYGGSQRLGRIAPPGVAREWLLTADMYSAEEAHRVGVINRLFEPEELEEGTMKLAKRLASNAPVAMRLGLEAMNRGLSMSLEQGLIIEGDTFGLASTTDDMREGMEAFLEKRKPNFQGK